MCRWLPEPLSLAGIWNSPTLSSAIDTAAVDAAAAVLDEEEEEEVVAISSPITSGVFIRSLSQPVDRNSFYQLGLLNEDEALRLILQATPVRQAYFILLFTYRIIFDSVALLEPPF